MNQQYINHLQNPNLKAEITLASTLLIIIGLKMGFLIKFPKFAVCK